MNADAAMKRFVWRCGERVADDKFLHLQSYLSRMTLFFIFSTTAFLEPQIPFPLIYTRMQIRASLFLAVTASAGAFLRLAEHANIACPQTVLSQTTLSFSGSDSAPPSFASRRRRCLACRRRHLFRCQPEQRQKWREPAFFFSCPCLVIWRFYFSRCMLHICQRREFFALFLLACVRADSFFLTVDVCVPGFRLPRRSAEVCLGLASNSTPG